MVYTETFTVKAKGYCDVVDITGQVSAGARRSGASNGAVTVFCPGSTCSVTTIEYESGAVRDLQRAIENLAPSDVPYDHDRRWGDGNGFSHVRAALMTPSLTVPLLDGRLALGTWQQIVFLDFDNRERTRDLILQVIGE